MGLSGTSDFTASGALLVKTFGLWLLGYLSATDEAVLRQRLASDEPALDEKREEVLFELVGLATRLASETADGRATLRLELADVLGRYLPEQRTTIGNALRLHAGGAIDVALPEDDVEAALISLMCDAYPLLLVPSDPGDPMWRPQFWLGASLRRHPAREAIEEAVLADRDLGKLFPRKTESSGWVGAVYRSTGAGGGLPLSTFPELLIAHAWWWQRLVSSLPSPEELARELNESLAILRKAIRGESTEIEALVALAGIVLPDGASLDTPVGTLRCMSEREREIVPSPLEGRVSHTSAEGVTTTGAYAGDVVLDTRLPYRIHIMPRHDGLLSDWPGGPPDHALLERKVDTIRLAILLTANLDATTTTTVTWRAKKDPLSWTPVHSFPSVREGPSMLPRQFSPTELEDWVAWIRRVHANRHPSVDVAVRRTISATSHRLDPADALIDLVIAWENLFGSRQGEPALRIAASLGWLLGGAADEREAVRSTVATLYDLRSDLVHGNRAVPPREATMALRIARDLTISVLRTLYEHRTDLLRMSGGADRSRNLVMDSGPPRSKAARPPSRGDAD